MREQIISAAKLKDAGIGDNAMIAPTEYGFWVGTTVYVSKNECGHRLFPSLPPCTLPVGHVDKWHRHSKANTRPQAVTKRKGG